MERRVKITLEIQPTNNAVVKHVINYDTDSGKVAINGELSPTETHAVSRFVQECDALLFQMNKRDSK
jgi:hypothetical protein